MLMGSHSSRLCNLLRRGILPSITCSFHTWVIFPFTFETILNGLGKGGGRLKNPSLDNTWRNKRNGLMCAIYRSRYLGRSIISQYFRSDRGEYPHISAGFPIKILWLGLCARFYISQIGRNGTVKIGNATASMESLALRESVAFY